MASERTEEIIRAMTLSTTLGKMEAARNILEDVRTDFLAIEPEKFQPLAKQCDVIEGQFKELAELFQKI